MTANLPDPRLGFNPMHDEHPTAPEHSSRRNFLKWLTHGLGAAFAATIGVPAVVYLLDPRNRPPRPGAFKVVAKLSDLKEGVPFEAVVRETRRDAWTLIPNDVIGRAWLIRRGDKIEAFTTTCPHLGCSVNFEGDKFVCPCHGGTFDLHGEIAATAPGTHNPAPRGMDSLELQLEPDPANPGDKLVLVKYENFHQGKPTKEIRT
jgi:menaquinol-cytochrome c reductase iron-sulfur subunit